MIGGQTRSVQTSFSNKLFLTENDEGENIILYSLAEEAFVC